MKYIITTFKITFFLAALLFSIWSIFIASFWMANELIEIYRPFRLHGANICLYGLLIGFVLTNLLAKVCNSALKEEKRKVTAEDVIKINQKIIDRHERNNSIPK